MENQCLKLLYACGSPKPWKVVENFSPSNSITYMINRLLRKKLAAYKKYCEVSLTSRGKKRAAELLRHRRLLEFLFVREFGLSARLVHSEFEKLETLISKEVSNRICSRYWHPDMYSHRNGVINAAVCCG